MFDYIVGLLSKYLPHNLKYIVFVVFAFGEILMAVVNNIFLYVFMFIFPSIPVEYYVNCVGIFVAVLQEPITSKLLPSLVVLVWAEKEFMNFKLRQEKYIYALFGGIIVGFLEVIGKISSLGFSFDLFSVIILHSITGLIIGGTVFRYSGKNRGRKEWTWILTGLLAGILIHYIWNTQIAFMLEGIDKSIVCSSE